MRNKKFFFIWIFLLIRSLIFWLFRTEINAAITQEQRDNITELVNAYNRAKSKWVTTMRNYEWARLWDNLTRAELAKMMSVYIEKMWINTKFVNKPVYYKDVNNTLWDLQDYIKKAYQYQIMWIDANWNPLEYFNPYWLVTRAEFWTVFSRVLYWSKYNKSWKNYYEDHLKALKNAWIMTQITNYLQPEVRWYVMLMMMRTDSSYTPLKSNDEKIMQQINKILEEYDETNDYTNSNNTNQNKYSYQTTPWDIIVSVDSQINSNNKITSNFDFLSINLDYYNSYNNWSNLKVNKITFKITWDIWKDDIESIVLESEDWLKISSDAYRTASNEFEININNINQYLNSKYNTRYLVIKLKDSENLNSEWNHELGIKVTSITSNADNTRTDIWFNNYIYYSYDIENLNSTDAINNTSTSDNSSINNDDSSTSNNTLTSDNDTSDNDNTSSSDNTSTSNDNTSDNDNTLSSDNTSTSNKKELVVTIFWYANHWRIHTYNNDYINFAEIKLDNKSDESLNSTTLSFKYEMWNGLKKYVKSVWIYWWDCGIEKWIDIEDTTNNKIEIDLKNVSANPSCWGYLAFKTNWEKRESNTSASIYNINVTSDQFEVIYKESWVYGWNITR